MPKSKSVTVKPIGTYPLTNYPINECPNCKRHFLWDTKDKKFFCVCDTTIVVKKD